MTFKQNLPIVALVVLLATAGVVALVFIGPTDEELLQEAAHRYAAGLGTVREVRLHGTVADIFLEAGPPVHAEFAKKDGTWAFSRDLFEEFKRHISDPAVEREMLDRLGRRLFQRFRTPSVKFNAKEMEKVYKVERGPAGLTGMVRFDFAYPQAGGRRASGRYIDRFAYREGRWGFEGQMGVLMDRAPGR